MDVRWSKWTAARERTVRLEALAKHYTSLGKLGLAPCQEENIASQITKRHRSGPLAVVGVNKRLETAKLEEICWLESGDLRMVSRATSMRVRRSLRESRQNVAYWRSKYLSGKSRDDQVTADRRIQAFSAKVRSQVTRDLNDKKERIVERNRDCGNHKLCQWTRNKVRNMRREVCKEGRETEP